MARARELPALVMAQLTARQAQCWRDYLSTLPSDHAHRNALPDTFGFGDSVELVDELAQLVLSGRKRGTASLPIEFTTLGEALPEVGDLSIILRSDDTPVAIIERVAVRQVPFHAVDDAFAAREGEGDGSLSYWQRAHRAYFGRVCARHGDCFHHEMLIICQCFDVVWPRCSESANDVDTAPIS